MRLREYWDNLQRRERRMVLGGVIVTLLLLLYAVVVEPVAGELSRLQASVHERHVALAWMQQAAQEVKQMNLGSQVPGDHDSLLALVDSSARNHKLGPGIKRLQPEGPRGVRVWLEQVPFDDVLSWVDALAARSVRITGLSVERSTVPGLVDLRIVVEGSQ